MAPFSTEDHFVAPAHARRPRREPARAPQMVLTAMERFSCLAERCEDTCCRDFTVTLDRESLDTMKATLARTPEGRERLVRLVVIGKPSRHADGPAHLKMDAEGACPMLDRDRRCAVHSTFGETALTTTCSVFPRTSLAVEGHLEVGGSLACPEVARLVLLSDEAPTLAPAVRPMLPRDYVGKRVPAGLGDAYHDHFVPVRALLARLFAAGPHPVAARLAFAANFAERVGGFFHNEATSFTGAERTFAQRRLHGEIRSAEEPTLLDDLARDLGRLSATGEPVLALVTTLLQGRLRFPHSARYRTLVTDAFSSLFAEALGHTPSSEENVPAPAVFAAYRRRRDALGARPAANARAERAFANWAQHHLLRHPFTDSGSLLEHLYKLGVQLGALRLLFFGHPALAERLRDAPDATKDAAVVDKVVVDVVQIFTKAVGHSLEFSEAVARAGAAGGGFTFGQLVLIAKFI